MIIDYRDVWFLMVWRGFFIFIYYNVVWLMFIYDVSDFVLGFVVIFN